jgi:hypothetical protein
MLQQIQGAGKTVQVTYMPNTNNHLGDLVEETEALCRSLDHTNLFIFAVANSIEEADAMIECARQVCREKRPPQITR